ncbi:MAG: YchJ family metal-binding protein [Halothiobacillaceae bacterium]|jgi:SEC-C motif-containing protein|nr:YchJ family metal-binding protein [Halothiobacillaceae bacterium]MDY0050408.1 YchJ family metal-binding protein [Halothiobacillaceae bacterium]
MNKHPCPCGSGHPYLSCCGRFIDQGLLPETAEQLMRSRYTAFTQANAAYLLASWHPSTRPESLDLQSDAPVKWLGLRIDKVEAGAAPDNQGRVCFVARSRQGSGPAQRLEECSRFEREQERWFYVDGDVRT